MNNKSLIKNIRYPWTVILIFSLLMLSMPVQAMSSQGNPNVGSAGADKISPQVQQALDSSSGAELHSVIVTLKAQADLSNIHEQNRNMRLNRVETALQIMANTTQNRIRALIASRQSEGKVIEVDYFWIFNGLAVTATADVIQEIAALPEVRTITPNETIQAPVVNENTGNEPERYQSSRPLGARLSGAGDCRCQYGYRRGF